MKSYHVKKISADFIPTGEFNPKNWGDVPTADIDCWPWHKEKYRHPEVCFQVQYSDNNLYVRFHVRENFVVAKFLTFQDPVCQDSCVEFFVTPDNQKYFNFEVNCIGTMLLYHCKGRGDNVKVLEKDVSEMIIKTSLPAGKQIPEAVKCPEKGYIVEYSIPFSLFKNYSGVDAPVKGTQWRGNFYKCGDKSPEPSWGTWSPVGTLNPDFHRPECFGILLFG